MAIPVSELQSINPSSLIELFTLELFTNLHGSNDVLRFHSGTKMHTNEDIVWRGNSYQRFPVEASGFEYASKGQIPRPTFKMANLLGLTKDSQLVTVSDLMVLVNQTTAQNDLIGAKFTRIQTLASSLDAVNFSGNTNPFGTPNADELPQKIFFVDRKVSENRNFVEFELTSEIDKAGRKIPNRQVLRSDFPGIGTFINQ
tara:strand:- start:1306 stop:1905 length:600 start_codon:yes stop_codon:yes gene_type:complete